MIEKFTKEELSEIIMDLKEAGYDVASNSKGMILKEEAEKIGLVKPYIANDIKKSIYVLADFCTENKKKIGQREYRKGLIPEDKQAEYRNICSGILKVIQPYYGMIGFQSRTREDVEDVNE